MAQIVIPDKKALKEIREALSAPIKGAWFFAGLSEDEKEEKLKKAFKDAKKSLAIIEEPICDYAMGSDLIRYDLSDTFKNFMITAVRLREMKVSLPDLIELLTEDALNYYQAQRTFELPSSIDQVNLLLDSQSHPLLRDVLVKKVWEEVSSRASFSEPDRENVLGAMVSVPSAVQEIFNQVTGGEQEAPQGLPLYNTVIPELISTGELSPEDLKEVSKIYHKEISKYLKRRIILEATIEGQDYLIQGKSLLEHIRAFASPASALSCGFDEWSHEEISLYEEPFKDFLYDKGAGSLHKRSPETMRNISKMVRALPESSDYATVSTISNFISEEHSSIIALHSGDLIPTATDFKGDPRVTDFITQSVSYEMRDKLDENIEDLALAFVKLQSPDPLEIFRDKEARPVLYKVCEATDYDPVKIVDLLNLYVDWFEDLEVEEAEEIASPFSTLQEDNPDSRKVSLGAALSSLELYDKDSHEDSLKAMLGSKRFIEDIAAHPAGYATGRAKIKEYLANWGDEEESTE